MTDAPQGRDGSPSVAALAVQVNSLRRDLAALTAKAAALTRTQQKHAAALDDIAELRNQVEHILTIVTGEDDSSPAAWFWLTMTEQDHSEKSAELLDWVETVLRAQYPDYLADQIRPCWPNHPEALWELAWLYQLWSVAYLSERPSPRDAADWHDRWSPGVIRRLSEIMTRCERSCRGQPGTNAIEGALRRSPL